MYETMKKMFFLTLIAVLSIVSATACGSDGNDDVEPVNVDSAVYGAWKCTDAKVLEIDLGGMSLPSSAEDMIKSQIEEDMKGEIVTLSASDIRMEGEMIVFKDSGIKWRILSLTSTHMKVEYNVESDYASASVRMKVAATFEKQ